MEFTELLKLRRLLSSGNWRASEYMIARYKSLISIRNKAPRRKDVSPGLVWIRTSSTHFPSTPLEGFIYVSHKVDVLSPA